MQEVFRRLTLELPAAGSATGSQSAATEGKLFVSKSASLPREPFENPQETTASWKQEVNQRLAAHRNKRGGQDASAGPDGQNARPSSGRAAEAAARVAARYAKAPSYSEILAGEARAAVRAAEAAAEAALNAHAAAQAVLDGLENRPLPPHLWQPANNEKTRQEKTWQEAEWQESSHESRFEAEPEALAAPVTSRWQDAPPLQQPIVEAAAVAEALATPRPWPGAQPRWEEGLTPPAPQDPWAEMRVHPAPEEQRHAEDSRYDQRVDHRIDPRRIDPRTDSRINSRIDPSRIDPHIYRPSRISEQALGEPSSEETDLFEADSHVIEPVQLSHANLIEFPRELVAARKARPHLAEGPLYNAEEARQLNIFETLPEAASHDEAMVAIDPPGWASIELDHPAQHAWHQEHHEPIQAYALEMPEAAYLAGYESASHSFAAEAGGIAQAEPVLRPTVRETTIRETTVRDSIRQQAVRADAPPEMLVASFSDRMLAGLVDGALVTLAFLAAAVVVIASTAHPPAGRMALIAIGCGITLFGILYQFLFLSFTEEGTPGMRYARIALCTFEDENPSVGQMLMRVPATVLATLPAGLGLLWSLWDKDQIGWHDRWTRTYQRKY